MRPFVFPWSMFVQPIVLLSWNIDPVAHSWSYTGRSRGLLVEWLKLGCRRGHYRPLTHNRQQSHFTPPSLPFTVDLSRVPLETRHSFSQPGQRPCLLCQLSLLAQNESKSSLPFPIGKSPFLPIVFRSTIMQRHSLHQLAELPFRVHTPIVLRLRGDGYIYSSQHSPFLHYLHPVADHPRNTSFYHLRPLLAAMVHTRSPPRRLPRSRRWSHHSRY